MQGLRIGPSSIAGRGVFATRAFASGEVIERCATLRVPQAQFEILRQTVLFEYLYGFEDGSGDAAIALGHGSLYNHSHDANADYFKDAQNDAIVITARRAIVEGKEITLEYRSPWLMRQR